jgi:hypothetical protein
MASASTIANSMVPPAKSLFLMIDSSETVFGFRAWQDASL